MTRTTESLQQSLSRNGISWDIIGVEASKRTESEDLFAREEVTDEVSEASR